MKTHSHIAFLATVLFAAMLALPAQAFELTYSSRGSSYQVVGTESAQDLLGEFHSSSPIYCDQLAMTEFTRVNSAVSCGSGNSNLDDLVELSFNLADDSDFEFQIGTDWGRGGAVIVNNTLSYITADDIWWSYNWNNADVISSEMSLTAGVNTIQWIGFEGCCNGDRSIRFSVNGGSFQALSEENLSAYEASSVPVPTGLVLMLSMLPLALRHRV